MTPLIKVAIPFAIVGTASVGGIYFGTDLFKEKQKVIKKTSIVSLIKEKHPQKRLISSSSITDPYWRKAYTVYREENKDNNKGNDTWRLNDWTLPESVTQEVDTTSEFIFKCNSNKLMEVEGEEDPLYKQVLKYCARDTLVEDLILENTSKRLLNSSSDQDTGKWTDAWRVYKKENDISGKTQDTWSFSDWTEKKGGDSLPGNYKAKCDERAKAPAFKLDNEDYKNVLSWCTTDR